MHADLPDTPPTLISQLRKAEDGSVWQCAWEKFFELYHLPIEAIVVRAFAECGWTRVDSSMIEETVSDVVVDLFKSSERFRFDPARGRFRNILWQIARWRVRDRITLQNRHGGGVTLEDMDHDPADSRPLPDAVLDQTELRALRKAVLATLLEDVRRRVSPHTFTCFELTKLQGHNPEDVANEMGVRRAVVDNAVHKVMRRLRELVAQSDYAEELKP